MHEPESWQQAQEASHDGEGKKLGSIMDLMLPEYVKGTCIGVLLAAGVDVDELDEEGWTPLMFASMESHPEAIKLLLANVEPQSYAGGKGYTAGRYFSRSYAEIICSEYRALGFFTVFLDPDQLADSAN